MLRLCYVVGLVWRDVDTLVDKKDLSLHWHDYSDFSLSRPQTALKHVAFQGDPWD